MKKIVALFMVFRKVYDTLNSRVYLRTCEKWNPTYVTANNMRKSDQTSWKLKQYKKMLHMEQFLEARSSLYI